ncbi:MAG TPA: DUF4838 domain-containing protein [Sumerlaeia bacterium]|nr:DUF4838 domain-containing protein [Sumerlaeia bacterium]
MKRSLLMLLLGGFALTAACARLAGEHRPAGLEIAKGGASDYQIVIAKNASPSTRYGAEELQGFLGEMTGARLPIVDDASPAVKREILLGDSARLRDLRPPIDFQKLGDEGYVLRTAGPKLVIAGGAERGNLYGVYGLLEDHLGCRWFTVSVSRIPKRDPLVIPPLDETKIPVLEYREPFVRECFDGDWAARNRVNSFAASLKERHGGKVGVWGVHTFFYFFPPKERFAERPEYYSEIDGKRLDYGQLCCTNEDLIARMTEKVRQFFREKPEVKVVSVSQNDCGLPCQCANCRALTEREGTNMGPVLHLVNRVAEAIEGEFPDKAISTLAYTWSRRAPKTMRPRRNVIIRLCSIECNFGEPFTIAKTPQNKAFVEDLRAWSKICNRIWIWDYTTSFAHYMTPFPNRHVLDKNIQVFVENNVKGIFEQNVYNTLGGEMAELDGYMLAKFLWNPWYGRDRARDEFLEAVYGAAAGPIREYLDLIERRVIENNIYLPFNMTCGGDLLTPEIMARGDALWDEAEKAVAYKPDVLFRLRAARTTLDYAFIELARTGGRGAWVVDQENLTLSPNPQLLERMDRFFFHVERMGVSRFTEWGMTLAEFRERCAHLREQSRKLGWIEPVEVKDPQPGLRYGYYEGNGSMADPSAAVQPAKTGIALTVDDSFAERTTGGGLRFEGFFEAKRDGIYTFSMISDDIGFLQVAGEEIIANRDAQQWGVVKQGFLALRKGKHPITVAWSNMFGIHSFQVQCAEPDGKTIDIPPSLLSHEGD